jgi:ribulose-phosphate 3-epimerase
LPEVLGKISRIRAMIDETKRPIDLEVDGGVDETTAREVARAGARALVAGNAVFRNPKGYAAAISAIRAAGTQGASAGPGGAG